MRISNTFLILFICMLTLTGCKSQESEQTKLSSYSIEITSSGFSPSTLTISVGGTVTWENKDSSDQWPASDIHPTHEGYPGSSLCEGFDSCSISPESSWSFIFNEVGTWDYHNHLNPGIKGTIIVE